MLRLSTGASELKYIPLAPESTTIVSSELICAGGWLILIGGKVVFDWVGLQLSKTPKLKLVGKFNLVFALSGPSFQPPHPLFQSLPPIVLRLMELYLCPYLLLVQE